MPAPRQPSTMSTTPSGARESGKGFDSTLIPVQLGALGACSSSRLWNSSVDSTVAEDVSANQCGTAARMRSRHQLE